MSSPATSNSPADHHPLAGIATTLLDSLTTAILLLDRKLAVRYANPAAELLLDQSLRQLERKPIRSLFEHMSLDTDLLEKTIGAGHSFTDNDVTLVLHGGNPINVDLTSTCLSRGDQAFALLEMRRIDQQKRINQELQQLNQQNAARDLVRGLAHEIKNPLGGLRGAAQLLEKELPDPKLGEFTRIIIEQADRLRNLVDRLLGPQRLSQREPHNIHMVLEKVRQLVLLDIAEGIEVSRDYDPSLPDFPMDPEQIEQAILNIVKNAAEALQGHGSIRITTRSANQITLHGRRHKLVAEIKIVDNGPGIPPELRETLFYPMVTGKSQGTGLGLSIAQTLVNQHDGRIDCASWPGHTEFTILLPISETKG